MSIRDSSLKQLTFVDTSTVTETLALTAGTGAMLSKTVVLADYPLTPITIFAGFVPIVITPHLAINAGADGNVSVGLTTSVTDEATLSAGLEFSDGSWQPVSQFSNSFSFQPPAPSLAASADAFVGPQLNLLIYDLVGPYVNVHPTGEIDITPFAAPQYQLFGELNVGGGVLLQVLDETIANEDDPTVISYRQLLAQGNFPPVITGVTPSPLVGPTSNGVYDTGTFTIVGANFFGGGVLTDGPLLLTGPSTVNSTGTIITRGYQIGCCAPQQGQIFHLFVTTPDGSASIADTITLP